MHKATSLPFLPHACVAPSLARAGSAWRSKSVDAAEDPSAQRRVFCLARSQGLNSKSSGHAFAPIPAWLEVARFPAKRGLPMGADTRPMLECRGSFRLRGQFGQLETISPVPWLELPFFEGFQAARCRRSQTACMAERAKQQRCQDVARGRSEGNAVRCCEAELHAELEEEQVGERLQQRAARACERRSHDVCDCNGGIGSAG